MGLCASECRSPETLALAGVGVSVFRFRDREEK